jgi:hypothetical protein
MGLTLLPGFGYTVGSVASGFLTDLKHHIVSGDKIPAMLYVLSTLRSIPADNKIEEIISEHYNSSCFEENDGFLCDKANIIDTVSDSSSLFKEAAQLIVRGDISLEYAKKCMESEKFKTLTNFVDTEPAKRRLNTIAYALTSGVPIIIQVDILVIYIILFLYE